VNDQLLICSRAGRCCDLALVSAACMDTGSLHRWRSQSLSLPSHSSRAGSKQSAQQTRAGFRYVKCPLAVIGVDSNRTQSCFGGRVCSRHSFALLSSSGRVYTGFSQSVSKSWKVKASIPSCTRLQRCRVLPGNLEFRGRNSTALLQECFANIRVTDSSLDSQTGSQTLIFQRPGHETFPCNFA
jgi:hypothetical protein